ncbi:hypothetical protein TCE0_013f00905 [Talaromyces pinophilus]|jgi:hypothetical protein|uniref:Uncharacterized protein n=1 Tax=Talaromyces pinophilus TaxID=128442 RepID=A0A698XK93_TALPI|nr:hypothetical protein TCE0_013f00905 [Talaromyces pinophilus]
MTSALSHGILLSNGSRIVHGSAAKVKDAFVDIPVTLHELHSGHSDTRPAFRGQSGFIEFDTNIRLPRHVHISPYVGGGNVQTLVYERIFVVGGVALVELAGEIYVVPPQTLVTIAPGVPHTWTACPEGVNVSRNTRSEDEHEIISEGKFLMLYEYEETTGFFPTAQTTALKRVEDYVRCDDLESIRIPLLTAQEVESRCWFIKDDQLFQPKEG